MPAHQFGTHLAPVLAAAAARKPTRLMLQSRELREQMAGHVQQAIPCGTARDSDSSEPTSEWTARSRVPPPGQCPQSRPGWAKTRCSPPDKVSVRFGWSWSPGPTTPASTKRSARSPRSRRLQADAARFPADEDLAALVAHAAAVADHLPRSSLHSAAGRVLCPRFRIGDEAVSTISVVAQFGSPLAVTLDELRIELIYPADERFKSFLRSAG